MKVDATARVGTGYLNKFGEQIEFRAAGKVLLLSCTTYSWKEGKRYRGLGPHLITLPGEVVYWVRLPACGLLSSEGRAS